MDALEEIGALTQKTINMVNTLLNLNINLNSKTYLKIKMYNTHFK